MKADWLTNRMMDIIEYDARLEAMEAGGGKRSYNRALIFAALAHMPAPEPQREPTFAVGARVRDANGVESLVAGSFFGTDFEYVVCKTVIGGLLVYTAGLLSAIPLVTLAEREREGGAKWIRMRAVCERARYWSDTGRASLYAACGEVFRIHPTWHADGTVTYVPVARLGERA